MLHQLKEHLAGLSFLLLSITGEKIRDEELARQWLEEYNEAAEEVYHDTSIAHWNYATNLTDYNQQLTVSQTTHLSC